MEIYLVLKINIDSKNFNVGCVSEISIRKKVGHGKMVNRMNFNSYCQFHINDIDFNIFWLS